MVGQFDVLMSNLDDGYRKLIEQAQAEHNIQIKLIMPLSGGFSGASLFLADATHNNENISKRIVIKLDYYRSKKNEIASHSLAREDYNQDFVKNHLVEMAYPSVVAKSDKKICLFYQLAGSSLVEYRPLKAYVDKPIQLSSTLKKVAEDLLEQWRIQYKYSDLLSSTQIVQCLFETRFNLNFGRIVDFLHRFSIDTNDNIIVSDQILPNPIRLVSGPPIDINSRRICFPLGSQHGDLNTSNILVNPLSTPDTSLSYYLIDFLHYRSDGCCLFDLLSLEFNVTVDFIQRINLPLGLVLPNILKLSSYTFDSTDFSTEFGGLADSLLPYHNAVRHFIANATDAYRDEWWLSLHLCGITVGLLVANISSISDDMRTIALVYSASHYQEYCRLVDVDFKSLFPAKPLFRSNTMPTSNSAHIVSWNELFAACNSFEPDRIYIGVFGNNIDVGSQNLGALGRVPWNAIVDFDTQSDNVGHLLNSVEKELNQKRYVHRLTPNSSLQISNIDRGCYWYAALGLNVQEQSVQELVDWMEWNSVQSPKLEEFFQKLAATTIKPATVIIFWDNLDFIEDVARIASRYFHKRINIVWTQPNTEHHNRLAKRFAIHVCDLDLPTVIQGIDLTLPYSSVGKNDIILPFFQADDSSPIYHPIPRDIFYWLEEECEILHVNLGIIDVAQNIEHYFLRGRKISWFELSTHDDVDRDITPKLIKRIETLLSERSSAMVELLHEPGAGGTTVAYRVAWEIHWSYPVMLARCISTTTIERIQDIYKRTQLPVLFVVDSATIASGEIEKLQKQILARKTPVTLLLVRREFNLPRQTDYLFPLSQKLSNLEAYKFSNALSKILPSKLTLFEKVVKDSQNYRQRTPFYFCLTAFEENFLGLENFVKIRINAISELEQKLLIFIAILYYFAQQTAPSQIFSFLLSLTSSESVNLRNHLKVQRIDLLIAEDDGWRPLHFYVAEEILIQLLTGAKERSLWRDLLPQYGLEIISWLGDSARNFGMQLNEQIEGILQGLFIERKGQDISSGSMQLMVQDKFSDFIEKIPTLEGKRIVFDELVKVFPDRAHYWAHRSRLIWTYATGISDYKEAISSINQALSLKVENDDYVLHHIKGMAYAKWANYLMERYKLKDNHDSLTEFENVLVEIDELIEKALLEFALVREEIKPTEERSYVSAIETITRYIEFKKGISSCQTYSEFFRSPDARHLVEYLSDAENLLDRLKRLHDGQPTTSKYVAEREYHLRKLYDDLGSYINGLWNLLGRQDVSKPRYRRSLVYAYLAKYDRNWDKITQKELETLSQLMEDNLIAEPGNNRDIRMWFETARRLTSISINQVIVKLSEWVSNAKVYDALDAHYYLYVLHTLAALDSSERSRIQSEIILEKCKLLAQDRTNRTFSFEWLGKGNGLNQLISHHRLGKIDPNTQFYEDTSLLRPIAGQIEKIESRQSGRISAFGLSFFFTPAPRVGHQYVRERDELRKVRFYVGFSYDGLRAWNVEPV